MLSAAAIGQEAVVSGGPVVFAYAVEAVIEEDWELVGIGPRSDERLSLSLRV